MAFVLLSENVVEARDNKNATARTANTRAFMLFWRHHRCTVCECSKSIVISRHRKTLSLFLRGFKKGLNLILKLFLSLMRPFYAAYPSRLSRILDEYFHLC